MQQVVGDMSLSFLQQTDLWCFMASKLLDWHLFINLQNISTFTRSVLYTQILAEQKMNEMKIPPQRSQKSGVQMTTIVM